MPRPFPCGGNNQPACPPVNAVIALEVIRWYNSLSPEHKVIVDRASDTLPAVSIEDYKRKHGPPL